MLAFKLHRQRLETIDGRTLLTNLIVYISLKKVGVEARDDRVKKEG